MIDNFALALSHGLILLAAWRLVQRPDLDDPDAPEPSSAAKQEGALRALIRGRRRA